MTPAATARRHSVTLLEGEISSTNSSEKTSDGGKRLSAGSASPVSRRPEQSPSSGDLPGRSGCHADVVTGDNGNASPRESSASFGDANAWPRLGNSSPTKSSGESEMVPMGIGCPIMHADPVKNRDEDDARGPFWGRWDPLPAAELAAAAAAQALANRHLPRLSNASSVDVVSVGGFPLADDDESLEDPAPGSFRAAAAELAAAAFVAHAQTASSGKCPRHARGLSFGNEPEFANNVSAQLADGSTPGSSRGASWRGGGGFAETTSQKAIELGRERAGHDSIPGTSPTERERGCVNDAFVTDEVAGLTFQDSGVTKETSQDSGLSNSKETKETQKTKPNLTIRLGQPPIPPGPPPANLKRLARDAAAARLRRVRIRPFPNPGRLCAHTILTLFFYNTGDELPNLFSRNGCVAFIRLGCVGWYGWYGWYQRAAAASLPRVETTTPLPSRPAPPSPRGAIAQDAGVGRPR